MFVCCHGTRTAILYGQTSTFVLIALLGALMLARRRPVLAGLALAVASYKLGVAAGLAILIALLAGILPVAVGAVTAIALNVAAALSMGVPPAQLAAQYVARVSEVYYSTGFVRSETGLRTLLSDLMSSAPLAAALAFALAAVALAVTVRLAWRHRGRSGSQRGVIAVAMLLWTLWASPHQTYDRVLILPAVWLVYWPGAFQIRRGWLRAAVAVGVTLMLITAIPRPIEYATAGTWNAIDATVGGWLGVIWPQRFRLLVLGLFAWALSALWRASGRASQTRPGTSPTSF
jgi:hypothetical protein